MTAKFLLDTNIISEPLRPKPNLAVLDKISRHQSDCAIASVVWHVLAFGAQRLPVSTTREAIERYLAKVIRPALPILPYDERAADWHATERARLVANGETPPFVDGQIAAIAFVNNLTLVTANTRDFAHFTKLAVVNWFDE